MNMLKKVLRSVMDAGLFAWTLKKLPFLSCSSSFLMMHSIPILERSQPGYIFEQILKIAL